MSTGQKVDTPTGIREAAKQIGVNEAAIRAWVKEGKVGVLRPAEKRGQRVLVSLEDVRSCAEGSRRSDVRSRVQAASPPNPPLPTPQPSLTSGGSAPPAAAVLERPTAELVAEFNLERKRDFRVSDETLRFYQPRFARFVSAFSQRVPHPTLLRPWLAALPVSDQERKHLHVTLRTFYNWLRQWRGVPWEYPRGMVPPTRSMPKEEYTAEELQQALRCCRTSLESGMLHVLAFLSLRTAEVARLRWKDLLKGLVYVEGKTGDDIMEVPQEDLSLLAMLGDGDHVFQSRFCKPFTASGVYQVVRPVLDRAGVKRPGRALHGFRHTVGTVATELAGDTRAATLALRHRSDATAKVYDHSATRRRTKLLAQVRKELLKTAPGRSPAAPKPASAPQGGA